MTDENETISISLPAHLLKQLDALAENTAQSRETLIENAVQSLVKQAAPTKIDPTPPRTINQGDIYWLQPAESPIPHPHLVIQADAINHSRIDTVVVVSLTSNLHRASWPGNVLLDDSEADLPRQSVVEVSKVSAVNKASLGAYIGTLDEKRVQQVLQGMRFVHRP